MTKIVFVSFLIALWYLISEETGWFYSFIFIAPYTFLVALCLSAFFNYILEPLVRWINK